MEPILLGTVDNYSKETNYVFYWINTDMSQHAERRWFFSSDHMDFLRSTPTQYGSDNVLIYK